MPNYHVKLDNNGNIIAGSVNKNGQWHSYSDVTEEALAAVRDRLLGLIVARNEGVAFAWKYDNGKTLILKLEEKDTDEIKE